VLRLFQFFKAWVKNPRHIGAIVPSSSILAQMVASQINLTHPGYLIELGPGTGALTKAILETGLPPERLVLIEQNPKFVQMLKKKFPLSLILQADAQELKQVLSQKNIIQINSIISGIPLRSLPAKVLINIIRGSLELLPIGSAFIQFTYGAKSPIPAPLIDLSKFEITKSERIWRNLPPARVWTYRKKA